MAIDPGTKAGARALERLRGDKIAWLASVTPEGQPQVMPIWFLWDDEAGEILLYSAKAARRNGNVRANPKVAFHFSDDGEGGDIVALEGEARFEETTPAGKDNPPYLAKYGDWLREYDWTPEYFSTEYPHAIRIRPTKVRGG